MRKFALGLVVGYLGSAVMTVVRFYQNPEFWHKVIDQKAGIGKAPTKAQAQDLVERLFAEARARQAERAVIGRVTDRPSRRNMQTRSTRPQA